MTQTQRGTNENNVSLFTRINSSLSCIANRYAATKAEYIIPEKAQNQLLKPPTKKQFTYKKNYPKKRQLRIEAGVT